MMMAIMIIMMISRPIIIFVVTTTVIVIIVFVVIRISESSLTALKLTLGELSVDCLQLQCFRLRQIMPFCGLIFI